MAFMRDYPQHGGRLLRLIYSVELQSSGLFEFLLPEDAHTLFMTGILRQSAASTYTTFQVQFNGDATTSNYAYAWHDGGTVAQSSAGTNGNQLWSIAANGAADLYSFIEAVLPAYNSRVLYKAMNTLLHVPGIAFVMNHGMTWKNLEPIRRVRLVPDSGALWLPGSLLHAWVL